MRVLLDECLPKKLKNDLPGVTVQTVTERGWSGKTNGILLQLAEPHFDVFVTSDQNLQYQQNLRNTRLAVILLSAKSSTYQTLKPLAPKILSLLKSFQSGQIVRLKV